MEDCVSEKLAKLLGVSKRERSGEQHVREEHFQINSQCQRINIIKVPCDDQKMRPDELEQLKIQVGFRLMDHKAVTCINYSEQHYNVHSC
ncbi:unnamed protein product [Rhizophagus irregularis]|uniref:Uncharacterized protein n=1 Tax=Rhizophagus irregularis TaxID=588596 RepID=A0A916EFF9_9GLOM|nr:unnamed protein product [Rhizophagus irregularis]CAB5216771.1 unnamed protein product [Rhizophagus irregularis]CAB5383733.1 unnamed protein product [Rhizophagus irregularis]